MTELGGSEWAFDGEGRLYDLSDAPEVATYGPPAAVRWVAPIDLPSVFGFRCALAHRASTTFDLRCASEVFESMGGLYLNVVDEAQWYRWLEMPETARPEHIPRATCIGARHVWIEINDQPETHPSEGDHR